MTDADKHKETMWQKVNRRLFAKPIISVTKEGYYTLAWHWKDGTCEVVKHGICKPGVIVEVPASSRVIHVDREEMYQTARFTYELEFMDGHKMIVNERTYSRAIVAGAYERLLSGCETRRQLSVVKGKRRTDLDRLMCEGLPAQKRESR
jgi:hypothetical protein